ncbi:MaoC family dehydratase [Trinickia caryophylli]|uniref:Acyl dehydratase n=1 Tax=Trinickia caryophylli TaxID=28094 RepID=A0A1X7GW65_TRICW|nr:MaoC family dehydratase [Trinickia caryophylli]PMS08671.1 MaoC family dehydratase [Trinickia caryophylli]TRX18057.1 MaoC family dehydratase [Trinickia caryophylli]WQE11160.1 MaoC family dehydratase [Trinickia caryophylli]SMF75354.1 Acyl dehydratase [Trinickia caryophylli]GLU35321.1 MaoC family dehydratase [Trinickia caryophylli]
MTGATERAAPAAPVARAIADAAALRALVGGAQLCSAPVLVDQSRIDMFAEATGDRQWIHVDRERAHRESPFGGTIAHGFLTLSLIPALLTETVTIRQRMGVNYGLNRVRFTSPVPAGARVFARFQVADASDVEGGGVQVTWNVTLEVEGERKPACVAEFLTRHYF